MWVRTTRITLLVALLLALAVLAWLAAHPTLYAGHVGRVISRNLLRDTGITFACRDLKGNPLEGMNFYAVSLTRRGLDGSFSYLTADSVEVEYDLRAILRNDIRIRRATVYGTQLLLRKGPEDAISRPRSEPPGSGEMPITLGRAELRDFSVTVTDASGELVEDIQDGHWHGSIRRRDGNWTVDTAAARGDWRSRDLLVHSVGGEARFFPADRRLEIINAHAVFDSTDAQAEGEFVFLETGKVESLRLDTQAKRSNLNEVLRILGKKQAVDLHHEGELRIRMDANKVIDFDGRGHGVIQGYPYRADAVAARLIEDDMRFSNFRGAFLEAEVSASGQLVIGPDILTVRGRAANIDLEQPWVGEPTGWPQSDLSGEFDLRLNLRPGRFEMDLLGESMLGTVLDIPIEETSVDLRYTDANGLVLNRAIGRAFGANFDGSGTVDVNDIVSIDVKAQADDLQNWIRWGKVPGVRAFGFTGDGQLRGPIDAIALRLTGQIERADGYGFEGSDQTLTVDFEDYLDWSQFNGDFTVNRLKGRGRFLGQLNTKLRLRDFRLDIDEANVALGDTTMVAQGAIVIEDDHVSVEANTMELDLVKEAWRLREPTTVNVERRSFHTPRISIGSNTGSFVLEGGIDLDGAADLKLSLTEGDLAILGTMGLAPTDLGGQVGGTVAFTGRMDRPGGEIRLGIQNPTWAGQQLDALAFDLDFDGRAFQLRSMRASSPHGLFSVQGTAQADRNAWLTAAIDDPSLWFDLWRTLTLDLQVEADQVGISQWLPPQAARTDWGTAAGQWTLRGTAQAPELDGFAQLTGFQLGDLQIPSASGHVRVDTTGITFDQGTISAPDPWITTLGHLPIYLSLAEQPRFERGDPFRLVFDSRGPVDIRPVNTCWPFFTRLEGEIEMLYEATGTLAAPNIAGSVKISGGVAQWAGTLEVFRDIEIEGVVRDNTLHLSNVSASEGKNGVLQARRTEIAFLGLLPDDIIMDFWARDLLLVSVPSLRAIGSSDDLQLRLVRPLATGPRAPKLTGNVVCRRAEYTGTFGDDGSGTATNVLPATSTPEWMADVRVRAQDRVLVKNDQLELRILGDFDFVRDEAGFHYRGQVEIPQGRVRVLYQDFNITRGRLDFSQGVGLDPAMNITAETEVPLYDRSSVLGRDLELVTVDMTGTMSTPQLTFTSESGYDEQTILRMLLGIGPAEGSGAGIGDIGYRVAASSFGRVVADQIDLVDTIDIQTQEAGLEELESTRIAVGKYLTNNLYLRFSQGLSITERDLFFEYQISRRWLFNSEVRRRLRENATQTQFNVDLKFRLEY